MTTATSESPRPPASDGGRRPAARFGLRNWRVRSRLTALILVPTAVGVVLAGTRVAASVDGVAGYRRTAVAAEHSGALRDLAQALGSERDKGAWASFQPSTASLKESADAQRAAVDALVAKVLPAVATIDDSYGSRVVDAAKDVTYQLKGLEELRRLPGTTRLERYSFMISPLLRLHEELTLVSDDEEIIGDTRALSALAYAKEEVSRQRARLLAGYYAPALVNAQEVEKFIASRSRMEEYRTDFSVEASPANARLLAAALVDERVYRAELTKARAIVLAGDPDHTGRLLSDFDEVRQWFSDNSTILERMRKVETEVAASVVLRARMLEETEQRNTIIASALILLLLLLVLGLTVVIARSMVTPLRRLRAEALEVAGFRLPEAVRHLRLSGEARAPEIAPISVGTTDEIGEVAKAFDEVHRQAIRLAAEESELRSNINAMFVNLSRRTQTLVERQISLIDGLEKTEEDGGRLADLFRLDHLATRMRRNSENLLVLAGHEPARRRTRPAELIDVVRASLSEVEGYERVQVRVHRTISIAGSAVNDVVHLVAELVENAIQFSPRQGGITVSSSMIEGGGALLAVSDQGIGMSHDELFETNRRLADPPVVDVSVSRRMGLFVVGRLALRHGIRVQLRPQEGGGLVAMVLFPSEIVIQEVRPVRTPSWGAEPDASYDLPTRTSAQPFPGHPSFEQDPYGRPPAGQVPSGLSSSGHPSFGHDSSGDSPFGRHPLGGDPFGQASLPDASSFGSVPLPAEHTPQGWAAPAGPVSGPPLPERQIDGGNGPVPVPSGPDLLPYDGSAEAMPTARLSPFENEQEEYLPIFASIESAWFRRADEPDERAAGEGPGRPSEGPGPEGGRDALPGPTANGTTESGPGVNGTAPDEDRHAGEGAAGEGGTPSAGTPDSGPVREAARADDDGPGGWSTPADAGWRAAQAASDPSLGGITAAGLPKRTPRANLVPGAAVAPSSPVPSLSPERVRSRLSSFQQGVRRGRAEVVETVTGRPDEKEEDS
ncbi:nitrate- and nitrite sensing domain-containing protein [Streptosporangium sp. NPDC050855]|uniref:sensor histidine kinase n=1 Tax=Streptosporangium sp. NPDC050855 TaxID=3366194 RepID=UPI00379BE862